jgi:16S rRNA G1207 methylase RsmC
MAKSAHITSTEAVSALRTALLQFVAEAQHALTALQLEARRPVEWLDHDRTLYWPREMRKASDRVAEARLELQRCEMTISGDDRRACVQEKKQLQKAKARLELTEERIRTVRRWKFEMKKAVEDFETQLARVQRYLENDIPIAAAELQRMILALEAYIQTFGDRAASSAIPSSQPGTSP